MIVVRKRVGIDKGQMRLFEEYRYLFYITNDREMTAEEIVFSANDRCNQENLIAQLKSGVRALTAPVDDLVSNWAYMVMASLAWSLKAWSALLVPVSPRHEAKHNAEKRKLLRMEFATFCAAFIQMPCQIVRGGRRLIYRLLSWNPWQGGLPTTSRAASRVLALLRKKNLKSGSGCPDPHGPSREEREGGDAKEKFEGGPTGLKSPEAVESTL